MLKSLRLISLFILAALAVGCASRNANVIFVTKTSLGIDIEPSTSSGTLAYDRVEGYSTPRYADNYIPPVVANFDHSGGTLINPKIKQVYATGRAAELIAGTAPDAKPVVNKVQFLNAAYTAESQRTQEAAAPGSEKRSVLFFGTGTSIGLKLGFSGTALDDFNFGYKRKEISVIPKLDDKPEFPSVLAAIDTAADTGPSTIASKAEIRQFFATGSAANGLAADKDIQAVFRARGYSTLAAFYENEREQTTAALVSAACVQGVDDKALPRVWADAAVQQLISKETADELKSRSNNDPRDARKHYLASLYDIDHTKFENTARIREHKAFVCGISQQAMN